MATTNPDTTHNMTSPPQEMPNYSPPDYSLEKPSTGQEIAPAQPTVPYSPDHVDGNGNRAIQAPQPAIIEPMKAEPAPYTPQPQPRDPLAHPIPIDSLREVPAAIDCPHCNQRAMTSTTLESGNTVMGWALAICCVLGVCCAWIPCVMDSCKDTIHFCTKCQNRVATHTNSGKVKHHAPAIPPRQAPPPSKA